MERNPLAAKPQYINCVKKGNITESGITSEETCKRPNKENKCFPSRAPNYPTLV